MTQEEMKIELEELAVRFSEGWHEGIKIDASDIMLLNKAAQALAQTQEPVGWTLADKVRQDLDRQSCPDAFMRIAVESIVKHHPPQRTEQEPVAWMDADGNVSDNNDHKCFPIPLYTHPPQEQQSCDKRTWVGLTDEEKSELWEISRAALPRYATYASLVEAKLKQKNGYAEEKNT